MVSHRYAPSVTGAGVQCYGSGAFSSSASCWREQSNNNAWIETTPTTGHTHDCDNCWRGDNKFIVTGDLNFRLSLVFITEGQHYEEGRDQVRRILKDGKENIRRQNFFSGS